jgi:PAS domain S-box-containing protein
VLWSIPAVVGLLVVVLGAVVLAGYWTQHQWPATPFFNAAPLMPVTAIMIGLAGLSLVLASGRMRKPGLRATSRVLAGLVIFVGAGLLIQYASGIDLRLISPFEREVTGPPWPLAGMPSPYTAAAMVFLGLALLLLRDYGVVRRPFGWASPALASLAMAVGAMASLGYASYLHLPLAGGPNMAPYTAIAVVLLGSGLLLLVALRSRAVLEGDGAPGAWLPAWIGGPVAAAVFTTTLASWVLILHMQAGDTTLDLPTASIAIVVIAGALGFASGAAAALLAGSRFQVRRTQAWADSLAQSQMRLRALFQQAAVGIELMSMDGRFLEVNDKLCEVLDTPRSELLGRNYRELTHPDDRADEDRLLKRLLERRLTSYAVEKRYLRPAGGEVWVRTTSSLALDRQGRAMYRISMVEDISLRKLAEEAVRDSEARKSAMLESALDCVISMDELGRIIEFNPAAERTFGYTRLQAMGKTVAELIIPERLRAAHEAGLMQLVTAGGERVLGRRMEMPAVRADGTEFPIELSITATRLQGQAVVFTAFLRDITDRLRSEAGMAHLAAIVESSDDTIISKDLEGRIRTFNSGAERLFGYKAEEVIGKSIRMLIPDDLQDEEDEILAKVRAGERLEHYETVRITKDGHRIDVSLTLSPIRDAAGRVVGASKIARDITARKRVEAELSSYRQDLERQVQARTAELERSQGRMRATERLAALGTLSAGLGHDMGNLLLPIRMRLDALEQETLPDRVREDLKAIGASAVYLQRLASSLRLFAMDPEELGRPGRGPEVTDLSQWWQDTEPLLRAALPRGVFLEVSSEDARVGSPVFPPVVVAMAPQRLMQAVFNLVQNAAEAIHDSGQEQGRVRITVGVTGTAERVRIGVEDNGPGMTPEVLRRCMEPFFSTKTRRISTGMGLSMVRGFIEQAGGTIEVTSELEKGTRFVVDLPLVAGRQSARENYPARCRAAVTIQDPRARALVEWSLRSLGADVGAGDAGTATDGPPEADVWVLDPGAASPEVLRRARSEARPRRLVVCGPHPMGDEPRIEDDHVLYTGDGASPAAVRRTLEEAVRSACESEGAGP